MTPDDGLQSDRLYRVPVVRAVAVFAAPRQTGTNQCAAERPCRRDQRKHAAGIVEIDDQQHRQAEQGAAQPARQTPACHGAGHASGQQATAEPGSCDCECRNRIEWQPADQRLGCRRVKQQRDHGADRFNRDDSDEQAGSKRAECSHGRLTRSGKGSCRQCSNRGAGAHPAGPCAILARLQAPADPVITAKRETDCAS